MDVPARYAASALCAALLACAKGPNDASSARKASDPFSGASVSATPFRCDSQTRFTSPPGHVILGFTGPDGGAQIGGDVMFGSDTPFSIPRGESFSCIRTVFLFRTPESKTIEPNGGRVLSRERLTWAGGKMSATALLSTPAYYMGRLEGSAPVAEHKHEISDELLCAFHAKGTFTQDGNPRELHDGECVHVPRGHLHAWQPADGSTLDAVQVYTPRGPEARFRTLAENDAKTPR